ncbi:hypothetical protein OK016_22155 [Vibrio chagasii]|nr:hypothetical protein [Vibrio chagasii]
MRVDEDNVIIISDAAANSSDIEGDVSVSDVLPGRRYLPITVMVLTASQLK